MSSKNDNIAILFCGAVLSIILFIYAMTMIEIPQNFLLFLCGSLLTVIVTVFINHIVAEEKKKRGKKLFEVKQRGKGLCPVIKAEIVHQKEFEEQQSAKGPDKPRERELLSEAPEELEVLESKTVAFTPKNLLRIVDVKDEMRGITVQGRVVEIRTIGEVNTKYGMVFLAIAVLEDESGRISLNLWRDRINLVKVGDMVRVKVSYVAKYENQLTLNVWGNKRIKVIWPSEASPSRLASDIANYIEKTSIESLFDAKRLRRLLLKFWADKYLQIYTMRKDPFIKSKKREVEGLALEKLQRKKDHYLESLSQKLISWALNKNLVSLTRADVKLFLSEVGLLMDTLSEGAFYSRVKSKYKYRPSWMRE